MNQAHTDYAALISYALAYLKDIPTPVFSTKEEWEALNKSPPPPAPILKKQPPSPTHTKPAFCPAANPPYLRNTSASKASLEDPIQEKKGYQEGERVMKHSGHKDDSKIKSYLQRISLPLSERIPDDTAATQAMMAYKEYIGEVKVVIFACDADAETLSLIKNLSKSIDQKLAPVKVLRPDRLEREERWDVFLSKNPLTLLIASCGFMQLKNAMTYYSCPEGSPHGFFNGIPLIILSACASYAHSPKEKLILWNQICTLMKH